MSPERGESVDKRVVVTGLGAVTPIGKEVSAYWNSLLEGKSGVGKVSLFDVSEYPAQLSAEVSAFNPVDQGIEKREARKMDRFTQFALAAAIEAWQDAGLNDEELALDKKRMGVAVGSGIGGIDTIERQMTVLREKGPRRVSPFLVPMLIANMASGYISIWFGLQGPNTTLVTACASSTHSIGDSYRLIQRGEADLMVAGGSEAAITPLAYSGFSVARALSTRNEEPEKASRPFDAERDGFVMGEGAGIVILENLESALSRGAEIYGEVVGYGMSGDAYHVTAPDPEGLGATLSMERAIEDAGISPEEVDYINAHGTSTGYNDEIETIAVKNVFHQHAYSLAVSSNKSMIGHLLGAAGGVELIATLLTLKHGWIPPTINYEVPDSNCDLDYVPNHAREQEVVTGMSNSFGFGGTNATLVVKKYSTEE